MARYKTIVLELLQDQYPEYHARLCRDRTLLAILDRLALALKDAHVAWMNELRRASPGCDFAQMASEALELAIEHLRGDLPPESPPAETESPFSLDEAMASVRRATPSASAPSAPKSASPSCPSSSRTGSVNCPHPPILSSRRTPPPLPLPRPISSLPQPRPGPRATAR